MFGAYECQLRRELYHVLDSISVENQCIYNMDTQNCNYRDYLILNFI